jgi:hypothetical protein
MLCIQAFSKKKRKHDFLCHWFFHAYFSLVDSGANAAQEKD